MSSVAGATNMKPLKIAELWLHRLLLPLMLTSASTFTMAAQEGADALSNTQDLLKRINNPVSGTVSLPVENDIEFGPGPEHALHYTAKMQPVFPFSLNEDWLVITRTVLPFQIVGIVSNHIC
jgi:hypothetical protein